MQVDLVSVYKQWIRESIVQNGYQKYIEFFISVWIAQMETQVYKNI